RRGRRFGDREVGSTPFRVAVTEPTRPPAPTPQEPDGFVGVDAEGATAVRDDLDATGQLGQPAGQLVVGDGASTGDVPGGVLGAGPNVDEDHVTVVEPSEELLPVDLLHPRPVSQVVLGEGLEVFQVGDGDVADGGP